MNANALRDARDYEDRYMPGVPEEERALFHLTGGIGWINDPNGFSYYKGEYHLFYQYHPYSTEWGPMHWGHAVTRDFIRWKRLPVALAPDTEADKDGCFSGSALEMPDGRHLLVYTGVTGEKLEDGTPFFRQAQCVAFGDGVNYRKYEGNPVLNGQDVPESGSTIDFRDPRVWRDDDGMYRMVVGNRTAGGNGSVLMYESADALHWNYVTSIDAGSQYGQMWECPDFFRLDGKQILMACPQRMQPQGLEFHAGNNVMMLVGDYDRKTHEFTKQAVQSVDYGTDFYAAQTVKTPDQRQIMIAWMQNWDTAFARPQNIHLFGEMTLPRELAIRNGKVVQNPVRELAAYRKDPVVYRNITVEQETSFPGVSGRTIDLTVTVRPSDAERVFRYFRIRVAKNEKYGTCIRYNPEAGAIRVDRTGSGLPYDIVNVRDFLIDPRGGEVKLRIILDRHSLELFAQDGEQAATFMIHTPQDAVSVSFEAEGAAAVVDIEKYELFR